MDSPASRLCTEESLSELHGRRWKLCWAEGCSACVCVGYDVDRGIPDGSGYVIEEEVQMMDGSHPTTDLRLTGGDMMYSTSWDTSVPLVCGV